MKSLKPLNLVLFIAGVALTITGVALILVNANRPPEYVGVQQDPTLPITDAGWKKAASEIIEKRHCNHCHLPDDHDAPVLDKANNCQNCHTDKGRSELVATPLGSLGFRRSEVWLRRYLRHPYAIRSNGPDRMPDLMLSDYEVTVLARVLAVTETEPAGTSEIQRESTPDAGRVAMGLRLFRETGCDDCHALAGSRPTISFDESGNPSDAHVLFAPELDRLWLRSTPEAAMRAISAPEKWLPHAKMPKADLSESQVRDLVWTIWNVTASPTTNITGGQVMSILRTHCNDCHYGPDPKASGARNPKGGAGWLAVWGTHPRKLDLTTFEGLMTGAVDDYGQSRPSVVPFADNSPLLRHIDGRKSPHMPMASDPLSAREVATIREWILAGAPDS